MAGVTRGDMFSAMLEKSVCTKVLITKVLKESVGGEEIGSKINYVSEESSAFNTVVKIEARGVFNVPLNSSGTAIKFDNWNSTSNIVDIEVYVGITSL